jgi:hypothetical protein
MRRLSLVIPTRVRGGTVGDLFLKTRADIGEGGGGPPLQRRLGECGAHLRGTVASGQVVRPAHAGAGSSVLGDPP